MKPSIPPGPKGLPLVGSFFEYFQDPTGFVTKIVQQYGPIVHFKLGGQSFYQLSHPDLIREVLMTQSKCFEKTGGLQRAKRVIGNGLLSSNGEDHRSQRKMLMPAFHPEQINAYAPIMAQYASEAAESWKNGQTLDLSETILDITLRITGKILLDLDFNAQATHQISKDLNVIFEHFTWLFIPITKYLEFLPLPNIRRFKQAKDRLDVLILQCILERKKDKRQREDMLSVLLQLTNEKGAPMSSEQIRNQVMTLFLAGHETIATALTWTFYCLSQNPEAEARLHEELNLVLGQRLPSLEDLPKFEYTRRVFAESMRLYPPVWNLSRKATQDFKAGEYVIPKGSIVGVSQFVMHRDPKYFPDPLRFDPDRFLPEIANKRPAFAYFPFGAGQRSCIGEYMGWMEGILILAAIAQKQSLTLNQPQLPALQPRITLRPKNKILVRIQKKSTQGDFHASTQTSAS